MKTITLSICVLGMAMIFAQPVSAQFQKNIARSLFSDQKAFDKGDAITILIVEDASADNSATTQQNTSTGLTGSVDINTGSSTTSPGGGISTGNKFTGTGQTSRKESLRAQLSARVISVDANGNMKIEGKRTTKVNGETQTITITGSVRSTDIRPDNSVYSYNIAELTLIYEGEGTVTKAQEPGLITKFLRILF